MITRPMKACDLPSLSHAQFPAIVLPKIDGVRGLTPFGRLRSRTMRPFANHRIMQLLSTPALANLDFEIACRATFESGNFSALCRNTTSIMNTIVDRREVLIFVFDDFSNPELPYNLRLRHAQQRINELHDLDYEKYNFLRSIHFQTVNSAGQIETLETLWLDAGYEGIVGRVANGKYKENRATVRENSFWRIKRFCDAEALVLELIEAEENQNESTLSPDGLNRRSSHSENKVGKNCVGAIKCLFEGREILVGPGEMTEAERIDFWRNPHKIINKHITFKHFPYGAKDKPRMATFKHLRENLI